MGKRLLAESDKWSVTTRTYILSHSAKRGGGNLDFRFWFPSCERIDKNMLVKSPSCNNLSGQPRKLISPTEPRSRWLVAVPTLPSDRSPRYPEPNRTQAAFETLPSFSTWKSWCSLKMASPASSGRGFRLLLAPPILPFLYPPTVPSHHIVQSKMKWLLSNRYSGSQGKGRRWGFLRSRWGFLRSRALFTGTSCRALKGFLPWNQSDMG